MHTVQAYHNIQVALLSSRHKMLMSVSCLSCINLVKVKNYALTSLYIKSLASLKQCIICSSFIYCLIQACVNFFHCILLDLLLLGYASTHTPANRRSRKWDFFVLLCPNCPLIMQHLSRWFFSFMVCTSLRESYVFTSTRDAYTYTHTHNNPSEFLPNWAPSLLYSCTPFLPVVLLCLSS